MTHSRILKIFYVIAIVTTAISISAQDLTPEEAAPDPNFEEKEVERLDQDLNHLCEELKKLKEQLESEEKKQEDK